MGARFWLWLKCSQKNICIYRRRVIWIRQEKKTGNNDSARSCVSHNGKSIAKILKISLIHRCNRLPEGMFSFEPVWTWTMWIRCCIIWSPLDLWPHLRFWESCRRTCWPLWCWGRRSRRRSRSTRLEWLAAGGGRSAATPLENTPHKLRSVVSFYKLWMSILRDDANLQVGVRCSARYRSGGRRRCSSPIPPPRIAGHQQRCRNPGVAAQAQTVCCWGFFLTTSALCSLHFYKPKKNQLHTK